VLPFRLISFEQLAGAYSVGYRIHKLQPRRSLYNIGCKILLFFFLCLTIHFYSLILSLSSTELSDVCGSPDPAAPYQILGLHVWGFISDQALDWSQSKAVSTRLFTGHCHLKGHPFKLGLTDLRKVPRRGWISHTHPVWLWGCRPYQISSHVPLFYGTK
jgi:hypothetical protein